MNPAKKEPTMMTPFLVLTQEVAALDNALRDASNEMQRSRSARRQRRDARRAQQRSDRRS